MTFEEFLVMLATMPSGADLVAFAKKMNDDGIRQTNSNKATRTALKTTEDTLKAIKANYSKVLTHIGVDEDVEDLDTALTELAATKNKGGDEALLKRLQKLENDRKKDKADADALLATERGKRHDAIKSQAIITALTAGKAIKPEKLIALLQNAVKVNDDDSLTFVDENGSELNIGDGVAAWLKANPEFVSNNQQPGGGSTPGGNGGSGGSNDFAKNLATENSKTIQSASKGQEIYFG